MILNDSSWILYNFHCPDESYKNEWNPFGALVSGLSATIVVGTTAADTSITAEMASF